MDIWCMIISGVRTTWIIQFVKPRDPRVLPPGIINCKVFLNLRGCG